MNTRIALRTLWACSCVVVAAVMPRGAQAQAPESEVTTSSESPDQAEDSAGQGGQVAPVPDNAALQSRIEELEAWKEEQEIAALEGAASEMTAFKPSLTVFGFMDLSLIRRWVKNGNIMDNIMHEEASFGLTNLNLFFQSRMTQSLSALVELRFTFSPQGTESFLPYARVDTLAIDPNTNVPHTLGGVGIERAQSTWQRFDCFGITVGRFLTPYGIWAAEHGSTVYLPMFLPYITAGYIVPSGQTGLMIHGRFFPQSGMYIDYALTAGNNRSDVESSLDFNDSKALGLRLRFLYETPKLTLSLGGYGYWGQVNLQTKETIIDAVHNTIDIASYSLDKHTELTGSLDFLLMLYGVRFQVEYARSLYKYEIHPLLIAPYIEIPYGGSHVPDHVSWDGYMLLAYDLPLQKLLGDMLLTPFVLVERYVDSDIMDDSNVNVVRAGFNFKPSSYWAIKLEGSVMWAPDSPYLDSNIYTAGAQVAVSF